MLTVMDTEVPRLRTALRDLVALSTIPAMWVGREPSAIAVGVVDLLAESLQLEFAFVRLRDPGGGDAVAATRGSAWAAFPDWLSSRLAGGGPLSHREIIPEVGDGAGSFRGIIIPVGVEAEGGLVAAASGRPDFPAEIDQLLLSVAANHAATAVQNARLIRERTRAEEAVRQARDELEVKVAERTAQLREAAEERQGHLRFLESVDRVNRAIQGTDDLERMTSDVLDAMLSIFECDRVWLLYPCDPDAPPWRMVMVRTRPEFPFPLDQRSEGAPTFEEMRSAFRIARASAGPIRLDATSDPPLPKRVMERSVQSALLLALHPKVDAPYMLGLVQCSHQRVWTPQEERLFKEIGGRLADGLSMLRVFGNLRQSEARLAEAQRIAHVAYWEQDVESGRVTWSDEAYRIFGLTPEEGPITLPAIQERIHPDDRPMMARAVEEAVAGGPRFDVEYRAVRPTGEVRVVHSQGDFVRDEVGRPRRMFGTLQDITERKEAEELTRRVFETLPDVVYVIDQDHRFRRVNAAFERVWQIPAERAVGMHVADLVGREAFEERFRPGLDRCLAGEEVQYATWLDLPGGRRFRSGNLSPLRSAGLDQIDAALVIVRDLTDQMLAADALQEAQAELARVTRVTMLGEITASIAHEVNQPLAAIVMNANACRRWLAADPPDLDEARDAAAHVVDAGERAGSIIARIRTLVRGGVPERHLLDVNDVIREAVAFVRSELERHGVAIETELHAALPPILGDRVQLQQVLVNLFLNAADAMAEGPAPPHPLAVASRRDDDGSVFVEVKDRGKGLDPEQASRLFEAFYSTKSGGLGMGLTISRSIVEMHGGKIWAVPNDGESGATLRFALPAASPSGGS